MLAASSIAASALQTLALAQTLPERGALTFAPLPGAHFKFTGPVGERVSANVDNWLLRAPEANPGMLEMFAFVCRRCGEATR